MVYNHIMSTYKKLLFIITPRAGIRKKDSALSDIILTFSDYGYETIVCFTRESGDAVHLVEEHVDAKIIIMVIQCILYIILIMGIILILQ